MYTQRRQLVVFRQGQMRERHENRKMEEKEVYMLISSTCKSSLATLTTMVILCASVPQWHTHYIYYTDWSNCSATERVVTSVTARSHHMDS